MNSFYLDASALAKRYAPEIGTAFLNHLFHAAGHNRFLLLNIGIAEVISLLVRKRNTGRLSPADFSSAVLEVDRELIRSAPVRKLIVGNLLLFSALSLIEKHGPCVIWQHPRSGGRHSSAATRQEGDEQEAPS